MASPKLYTSAVPTRRKARRAGQPRWNYLLNYSIDRPLHDLFDDTRTEEIIERGAGLERSFGEGAPLFKTDCHPDCSACGILPGRGLSPAVSGEARDGELPYQKLARSSAVFRRGDEQTAHKRAELAVLCGMFMCHHDIAALTKVGGLHSAQCQGGH